MDEYRISKAARYVAARHAILFIEYSSYYHAYLSPRVRAAPRHVPIFIEATRDIFSQVDADIIEFEKYWTRTASLPLLHFGYRQRRHDIFAEFDDIRCYYVYRP